jgi:hypothetical protein
MKATDSRSPIGEFVIPSQAPPAVEAAHANFERVSQDYLQAGRNLREGGELAKSAVRAANIDAAEARVMASAPPKKTPSQVAADWEKNLETLRQDRATMTIALDKAGNELAAAISDHRAEWIETLEDSEAESTQRLSRLLGEVRQACQDIQSVRSGPGWLQDFNETLAIRGAQTQFVPGNHRLTFPNFFSIDTFTQPEQLIEVLESVVTGPPAPPAPRKLNTVKREDTSAGRILEDKPQHFVNRGGHL